MYVKLVRVIEVKFVSLEHLVVRTVVEYGDVMYACKYYLNEGCNSACETYFF